MVSTKILPRVNFYQKAIRKFDQHTTHNRKTRIKRAASLILAISAPFIPIALLVSGASILPFFLASIGASVPAIPSSRYINKLNKKRDKIVDNLRNRLTEETSFEKLTQAIKTENLPPLKQALLLRKLIGGINTYTPEFIDEEKPGYADMLEQLLPKINNALRETGGIRSTLGEWLLRRQIRKVMPVPTDLIGFDHVTTSPYRSAKNMIRQYVGIGIVAVTFTFTSLERLFVITGLLSATQLVQHLRNKTERPDISNQQVRGFALRSWLLASLTTVSGLIVQKSLAFYLLGKEFKNWWPNIPKDEAYVNVHYLDIKEKLAYFDQKAIDLKSDVSSLKWFAVAVAGGLIIERIIRYSEMVKCVQNIDAKTNTEEDVENLVQDMRDNRLSPTKQALLLRKLISRNYQDEERRNLFLSLARKSIPLLKEPLQPHPLSRWLLNRQLRKIEAETV